MNFFLRYSAFTFGLKQKVTQAPGWSRALPYAFLLIISELGFAVVSIPLYVLVSPSRLQERGFIFPAKEKEKTNFQVYIVRRKISLVTVLGAVGIWAAKVVFLGIVSFYLLGAQQLLAATQNWDFSTAGNYTYDGSKIAVTGGVAQLVNQGSLGSLSQINRQRWQKKSSY